MKHFGKAIPEIGRAGRLFPSLNGAASACSRQKNGENPIFQIY